jgi:diguanylate cyclase (GGDEF)-like protein
LARALGRSEALFRLLEIAAEEARVAMDAASVSVSRLVPGTLNVRTIVNVGELGPTEVRWPEDETYTLAVDGRLWGEFYATRHVGVPTFDDLDTAYMEALLALLSGAVSRALREESLEQLAYRDPLTGLLNRRALDEAAEEAFAVEVGKARTVTAVTIDINRLKLVNDTLGHVAGDQLIQAVGRDLQSSFGVLTGALVARVGGDEFSVLVTGSDPQSALTISDELCRHTWRFGPGAGVSAGAASVRLTGEDDPGPTDLFAAADRAQYVAKHGRLSTTVMSEDFDPVLLEPEADVG